MKKEFYNFVKLKKKLIILSQKFNYSNFLQHIKQNKEPKQIVSDFLYL